MRDEQKITKHPYIPSFPETSVNVLLSSASYSVMAFLLPFGVMNRLHSPLKLCILLPVSKLNLK